MAAGEATRSPVSVRSAPILKPAHRGRRRSAPFGPRDGVVTTLPKKEAIKKEAPMHITPINPVHDIYPATADYVHAMQVTAPTRWLFISGTMGLASDSRAAATLDGQLA